MSQSMFERYGGFANVSKIVIAFYHNVLESDVLAPYFDGVDMRQLIDHQTKFISQVMGGPAAYTDSMLRQLHAPKRIQGGAFDEMIALLRETFEDFELEGADIDSLMAEMEGRRGLIVTGDSQGVESPESLEDA